MKEGVQSAFAEGIDDTESIETVRGGSPPPLCPMLLPDVSILYPPLANRRSGGLPSMSSYHGEHTGTFTYCVCEIVLMRHGRSVDALMSANLSRLLDELARDLMTQIAAATANFVDAVGQASNVEIQEISKMTLKSLSILCDASPKGHMNVWLPVLCCNDFAAVGTLQKLAPLHFSEEQLLAVHNCIQHVGFSFDQIWPEEGLRPIDPLIETRLSHEFEGETRTYVHNAITKECHWEPLNGEHYRLVLAPDEGSSLFTGFMFLASKGAAIGFNRDERNGLKPTENEDEDFENVVGILSKLVKPPGFPCPFPSYKAGVNPFHILSKQTDVEAPESNFEKVLRVDFSRDEVTAETLVQQVFAYLSCCFELLEYASYHRSSLERRICNEKKVTPATPELTERKHIRLEDILKPFPTTSVEIFQYTFHVADAAMAAKTGSILIRRAPDSWSLLVFLFRTERILTITSAALSELLNLEGLRLPKNAAKAAKIRKLMESAAVVANTDQIFRDRMEAQLLHQEQKKSKRKAETADEQDEEGDAEQAEQDIDPACAACEQLLAELEKEDEADLEVEDGLGNLVQGIEDPKTLLRILSSVSRGVGVEGEGRFLRPVPEFLN
ncbi:hypothetical protein AK812_SmicGene2422 [Symbiodinium microadriaticum]|uniref:Uncharacterized protein n=1 Tax=Symbiodinium microadriaticum TaxID=2951 RepID=A0A1Q9F1N8_SYMMI|nr:hypothetical protein AK812_SmicGene2422 [Symbiodinium microadriaticum]